MVVESQGGLIGWVQQYGNIVFFFGQIVFWVVIAAAAGYAALLYKRYVDFITGTVKSDESVEIESADAAVAVDEFVE